MNKKLVFCIIGIILLFILSSCSFKQLFCNHDYDTSIVEATCHDYGQKIFTCKKCEKVKTEVVLKKEHLYVEDEMIKDSTCDEVGSKYVKCNLCGTRTIQSIEKKAHDYVKTNIPAKCDQAGYTLVLCANCDYGEKIDFVEAHGHDFDEWEVVRGATEISDGLEKRSCNHCLYEEKRIISSLTYIDLDIIKFNLDQLANLEIENINELQTAFDACILNKISFFKVKYKTSKPSELLKVLVDNCSIDVTFSVNYTYSNSIIEFNFEFETDPLIKASELNAYVQYQSANFNQIESKRNSDFDSFKINNSLYSYCVATSEQLFYCLERGVKPICIEGSDAEKMYQSAKNILRSIIDDEMNDFEKIKAIHDWLIINVTYDADLLNLAYIDADNLSTYRGFYLEGVFIDQRAVCEGISKAFVVLANIEGIPCVQVEGYQVSNPVGIGHAWNKVYVDGKWYIIDATSDGVIVNESFEILSYEYFLITNEQMTQKYVEIEFKNLICDTEINAYSLMNYQIDENNLSFSINNTNELLEIIRYFNLLDKTQYTIQFYVDFEFGTSINDELQNVYNVLEIPFNISYITNENIVTIIK